MNANELADELNRKCTGRLVGLAAIKLRQQQSEIEALKLQNAKMQSELQILNWNEAHRLGRIG